MIFVTGGTGLVGSHLLLALAESGKPIRALYRNHIPDAVKNLPGIEWVQGDITDILRLEEVMTGIEQVYHCAAIVSFLPKEKEQVLKQNAEGTANIVNAALLCSIKKLIFVSSVAALGRMRPGKQIDETMHWTPSTSNSVYGKSKYLAEMEVWRGIGEGLNAAIINPTIILGESDWNKSSSAIFKSVYNEFPWFTEGTTGFVDVKDVVQAMTMLMDSDISGQRFILSQENRTYRSLFDMIAKEFGKRLPHKKVTPFMAKIVWRVEALKSKFTGKAPLVTKETAQTALTHVQYNNSKLNKFLPDYRYTPMEDSVKRICSYFLKKQG